MSFFRRGQGTGAPQNKTEKEEEVTHGVGMAPTLVAVLEKFAILWVILEDVVVLICHLWIDFTMRQGRHM